MLKTTNAGICCDSHFVSDFQNKLHNFKENVHTKQKISREDGRGDADGAIAPPKF